MVESLDVPRMFWPEAAETMKKSGRGSGKERGKEGGRKGGREGGREGGGEVRVDIL
jgi:hypothetical protein